MLSGITNYFFGGFFKSDEALPQMSTDDNSNPTLTLEDDGDWMLVHSTDPDESMALVPVTRSPLSCVENSWYIAGPPGSLDISPLESILLDNSVCNSVDDNKPVTNAGSTAPLPKSKKYVTIKEPCVNNKINQVIRNLQNETQGQKMMQLQQVKFFHLKQLDRQNKVQDYQSKNQRQRRKDHSHRPSGRSNDRKC